MPRPPRTRTGENAHPRRRHGRDAALPWDYERIRQEAAHRAITVLALVAGAPHCPADPHRTLATVTGGTLEVGVSHNKPFTCVEGPAPSGPEAEFVRSFAETLDAEVAWTVGGEEELVGRLVHGQLDLLIGGLTQKIPWQKKVGLTQPYTRVVNEFGQAEKQVMAVRKGENAFLLELDTFLRSRRGRP